MKNLVPRAVVNLRAAEIGVLKINANWMGMKIDFPLLAAAWVSFASPSFLRADIAPNPMSGGVNLQVPGNGKTEIVLVHNTVQLKVSPARCWTRAFFRLHNTGPATELDVGFPFSYEGEAADFELSIDNQTVKHSEQTETGKTPIGQPVKRWWKVWNMTFATDETHLVEVRYSNVLNGFIPTSNVPDYYPFVREWRAEGKDYSLRDYGCSEAIGLHDAVMAKSVSYMLITGSYWKGPIERCRVEAEIEDVPTDSIVDVWPAATSFSAERIVWEWKHVDPANNVVFTFVGNYSPRGVTIPVMEQIAAQNPADAPLRETLELMKRDFSEENIKLRRKRFDRRE